jgi:hypothetical protein
MFRKTRGLLIALCFFSLTTTAFAVELPFGSRVTLDSTYLGAGSITAGDIDRDGYADLVAAGINNATITWWQSQGDGNFVPYDIVAAATALSDVELADIDGDGDLDVLVTASAMTVSPFTPINAVGWYVNDGTPTGTGWTLNVIATSFIGANGTATGDFNGDGHLDVVGVALNAGDVTVALNNTGTGVGWSYETVDSSFAGARWVSAGDIDNDGAVDVAAAAIAGGEVAWWSRNAGPPATWTKNAIATVTEADVLELADMDKDGDLDVLGASRTGNITWWENNGSGGGWAAHTIGDPTGTVSSAYATDFDLDGDLDVLYSAYGADGVGWFENQFGDGLNWQKRVIDGGFSHAFDVVAFDFDSDGDPDLGGVDFDDGLVAVWENLNNHRSVYYPQAITAASSLDHVQDMVAADIDQDGDSDLLIAELVGEKVSWVENTSGDASAWTTHGITSGFPAKAVAAGDLNRDGRIDVVTALAGDTGTDPVVLWWDNHPSTGWTQHTVVDPSPHHEDHYVGVADLDGDGDLDIAVGSYGDGFEWYENDGAGGTWTEHYLTGGHPWDADSATLADIDGDGDTDLVYLSSDTVSWVVNNSGTFGATTDIATGLSTVRSVAACDIDGDGDLDIAAAEDGTDSIWWWSNDSGDGSTWGTALPVTTSYPNPRIIRSADLDNDGDPDFGMSSEDRSTSASWVGSITNFAAGWGWSALPATTDGVRSTCMALADFDGDGDVDLAHDDMPGNTVDLYLNQGGQAAIHASAPVTPATLDPMTIDDVLQFRVHHEGRTGDSDLELATVSLKLTDGDGTPLTDAEADALLFGLYIFFDEDNNSLFDKTVDSEVTSTTSFSLTGGVLTIDAVDGDSQAQIPFSEGYRRFFVAIVFENDAARQSPGQIEVEFLQDSTVIEATDHDLPVTHEERDGVSSGTVVPTDPDLIFSDGFESGNTSAWSGTSS